MSEAPSGGQAGHNIYTVLVILATVLVAGATVYLAVRSQQLYGDWNPFSATRAALGNAVAGGLA